MSDPSCMATPGRWHSASLEAGSMDMFIIQ